MAKKSTKTTTKTPATDRPAKSRRSPKGEAKAQAMKTARLRKEALAVADANLARLEADAGATTPTTPEPAAATPKDPTPAARAPRARKPKPAAEAKKTSGLDLAAQVLADAGRPLPVKDITELVLAAGWITNGATPEATLYAAIIREIAAKGQDARFCKTGRGLFAATGKAA